MSGRPQARINLVIACWSGPRRHEKDPIVCAKAPFQDSGLSYLRKQVGCLSRLEHSLTQITLVFSHDPSCPEEYNKFVGELPGRIGNAYVVKHFRHTNKGISYGSWAYAVDSFKNLFDYYIFLEDDYCFVKDNFDWKLMRMYDERCEYMCSYRKDDIYVTNGFISAANLAKKNWQWPLATPEIDAYQGGDMRLFVDSFKTCMFKPPYTATPFFGHHKEPGVIILGEGDFLLAPTQTIHPETFNVHLGGAPHY